MITGNQLQSFISKDQIVQIGDMHDNRKPVTQSNTVKHVHTESPCGPHFVMKKHVKIE